MFKTEIVFLCCVLILLFCLQSPAISQAQIDQPAENDFVDRDNDNFTDDRMINDTDEVIESQSLFDFSGQNQVESTRSASPVPDAPAANQIREVRVRVGNRVEKYYVPATRVPPHILLRKSTRGGFALSRYFRRIRKIQQLQRQQDRISQPITDYLSTIEEK